MKSQEFEIITDKSTNFKVFLNVLKYRSPHLHLDYEIGFVMSGNMDLIYEEGEVYHLKKGDFMCVNPYQIHEFRAEDNVRLLLLQLNPIFFKSIYPQIQNLEFVNPVISARNAQYNSAYNNLFKLAFSYMEQRSDYELECAGLLSLFFYDLMNLSEHRNTSYSEAALAHNKATRMRHIADYIEQHIEEKILLSDIAEYEHLTLSYLSHFFKDNFHMTFQEYVTKLRCERARSLMLTTDLSFLDISISCGFSDPKYFKSGFTKQYGCSPKDYRMNFGRQELKIQQASMLTTQQILSRQTSIILLTQYLEDNPLVKN